MAEPIRSTEGQGPRAEGQGSTGSDDTRPAAPGPSPSRLRALSGLALLAAMGGGVWAFGYWEPRLLPVRVIEVQGELHHHSSELLQKQIGERLSGGILTADLAELKRAAEGLPWVGRASLRRVWPDRLQVRVQEHKPAARWGADGLVTAEGLVFHPRTGTVPAGLPMLEGDEKRAPELVSRYLQWRDELMLAGQLIDTLAVDARGAWRLDLVSGTRLELGTDEIEERLTRFIGAAPQLDAAGRAELVDMRYSNGFAVKWAHSGAPATEVETLTEPGVAEPKATGTEVAARKAAGRKSVRPAKAGKSGKSAKSTAAAKLARTTPANAAARTRAASRSAQHGAAARSAGATAAAEPVLRPSGQGAPVVERPLNGRQPAERKLQAQADRKASDRNL